jgi:hypothetical protein
MGVIENFLLGEDLFSESGIFFTEEGNLTDLVLGVNIGGSLLLWRGDIGASTVSEDSIIADLTLGDEEMLAFSVVPPLNATLP